MRHMRNIAVWGKTTGRVHMISLAQYQEFVRRGFDVRVIAVRTVLPLRGII